jgi:hypothetical protein
LLKGTFRLSLFFDEIHGHFDHFFYPATPVVEVFFEYFRPRLWLWRFSFLCLIRPSSEIWTWLRFVISTLLSFICPDCRKSHVANSKSSLNAWWMLAWLPWSFDWHAYRESGVGLVKTDRQSRHVLCGEGMLRQPLSVSIFSAHQEPRGRGIGRVVCLSVVTPYAIRGSPMNYDNRAAA